MHDVTRGALHLAMQITHSTEDARDILQDALMKSLQRKGAPRPGDEGFRPWLYRVVHNQSIDWLRYRRKFTDTSGIDETAGTSSPEEEYAASQRSRLLHQALGMLPVEQREIICLKDFHDFSYREIGDIMGIEQGTVMSRLHRARKALKVLLTENESITGGQDAV